jgi:hypothetical protein
MIRNPLLTSRSGGSMPARDAKALIHLALTQAQKSQVKDATGRDGEAIELTVEELEERIAPRLASNHNETMLADG